MKKAGYSNRAIREKLGIKNVSQIKTWMKWYRTDQTYRFQQPVGKQYSYGKGPKELSELEQLRLENKHLKTKITVKELCNVLELPRSTFYRWLQRTEDLKDGIEEKVKDVCLRHKFRYGYRRVTATLRKMGLCVNHKKVLRIMKQYHILSKVRRKKKKYINGAEPMVAPHRLERVPCIYQRLWMPLIVKLLVVSLAMKTLKQAMRGRKVKDVLLHSDQGSILYSKRISSVCQRKRHVTSMSRRGNCHDNAVMESFFGHLKSEAFYSQKITKVSNTTVRKIVLEYIHYYNCVRIQEKLNHLSPKEFREQVV